MKSFLEKIAKYILPAYALVGGFANNLNDKFGGQFFSGTESFWEDIAENDILSLSMIGVFDRLFEGGDSFTSYMGATLQGFGEILGVDTAVGDRAEQRQMLANSAQLKYTELQAKQEKLKSDVKMYQAIIIGIYVIGILLILYYLYK